MAAVPSPYEVVDVEVDKPLKKPQQIENVLTSSLPWAGLAPLVFVGTNDATLHCLVPSGVSGASSLKFLRYHTAYKKIFHACARVLDTWGVYLTLMDSKLTMYTLPLHTNPQLDGNASGGANNNAQNAVVTMDDTKHTVAFAVSEDLRIVACLTKQNTLKVYDWTVNRTLELRVHHELPTVIATTKLLTPAVLPVQKMLVLGESHVLLVFKKEWCVVNVNNGKIVELNAASSAAASSLVNLETISCATTIPPSPRVAAAATMHRTRDAFIAGKHFAVRVSIAAPATATAYSGGDAALKVAVTKVLEYNVPPKNAFHHHPFLLVDTQEKLTAYNIATLKPVDNGVVAIKAMYSGGATVSLPSASPSSSSSSLSRELAARGLPASFLAISRPFSVQLLQLTSVPALLEQYVSAKKLEDAVTLVELCPDDVALNDDEKKALFTEYAEHLFRQDHQFNRAMEYYWRSRAAVDDVLQLYPRDLLPRVYVVASTGKKSVASKPPVVLQGEELVKSLAALIDFLTRSRDNVLASIGPHNAQAHQQRLELLDTVLLKCLVLISEKPDFPQRQKLSYQLFELVRAENWCEVGETEVFLRAHNQYDTLLSFYASRKLHRKTLELLEDLERSAAEASSQANPMTGLRTPSEYLERTAQYLKRLGHKKEDLVFEFSRRVIFADPILGLSIFTQRQQEELEDPSDREIDPAVILNHLKVCPVQPKPDAPSASGDDDEHSVALPFTDSRFLAIEYITQVILQGDVAVAPRLHDGAVYLILDSIHSELNGSSSNPGAPTSGSSKLATRASSQRGVLGILRRKLLQFLECPSAQYHPERMLSRTPQEMVDERAALLSRLGRHHEVLQLYALQLRDAPLAEAYCNRCYESKQADSSIYSTLLRLYLRPTRSTSSSGVALPSTSPPKPLWQRSTSLQLGTTPSGPHAGALTTSPSEAVNAAINVLNKYAERIDMATALDLLPSDVPVAALSTFFRRVLERQVERYRNGQIKTQLAKMENFKVREKLTTKRKESVTVWSSHCCFVCGKKLGVGTFVRLPPGSGGSLTLVHYACQPGVTPTTQRVDLV